MGPDALDMMDRHLVLVNRKSGKHASLRDSWLLAIKIDALKRGAFRCEGGILQLIAPKSFKEIRHLAQKHKNYEVIAVTRRAGRRSGTPLREELRTAVMNDAMIVSLAKLFLTDTGGRNLTAKAFIHWLLKQLKNNTSDASRAVNKSSPSLADAQRNQRWWLDQIKARIERMQS